MITIDPFQSLALSSARNDAVVVRGRVTNSFSIPSLGISAFATDPINFYSSRVIAIGQLYTRYRIKTMIAKVYITLQASEGYNPVCTYGFDDDINNTSPPTNTNAVSALRCSATTGGADADNGDACIYTPLNNSTWYYTYNYSDLHFQKQNVFYIANPSGTTLSGVVEFGYVYVFAGGAGNGTNDIHSSDPFDRPLTLCNHNDKDQDDPVVVRTPRPTPISTGTAPKGYFSR
jgi:hypothetical protein